MQDRENNFKSQVLRLNNEIALLNQELEKQKQNYENLIKKEQEESYNKGLKKGDSQGVQRGKAEFEKELNFLINALKQSKNEFDQEKANFIENLEDDVINFVLEIANQVIRAELIVNKESIKNLVLETLNLISNTESIIVRVNPDDLSFLREQRQEFLKIISGIKKFDFEPDYSITQGGCVVEIESGKLDARIESQLEILTKKIYEVKEEEKSDESD